MGLGTLGLGLSLYLAWHSLAGSPVAGCGGGSPCDQVLGSRWSMVGGRVPVSGLAAGAYLALLMAVLHIGPSKTPPVRRLAWRVMLILCGSIVGSAVWFTVVQKWIVGAFCPYCMAAHITGLLLSALVFWQAPRQLIQTADADTPSPAAPSRRPALTGLALAGVMAACQAAYRPPSAFVAGEAGRDSFAIDPRTVPLVGPPTAPHIVTLLFDYKCPHCQKLHFMLNEAVRRYSNTVAFALCPTPLSTNCNPHILREIEAFKDSCEMARIGLAVWLAKREVFPAFELWMFTMESGDRWRPRSLDDTRRKAVELVGRAPFEAAMADPWIDRHLRTSIRLYGNTGSNAIPKLVSGSRWVMPTPDDADDLVRILQKLLTMPDTTAGAGR